jgi:hypothetical protein
MREVSKWLRSLVIIIIIPHSTLDKRIFQWGSLPYLMTFLNPSSRRTIKRNQIHKLYEINSTPHISPITTRYHNTIADTAARFGLFLSPWHSRNPTQNV